MWMELAIFALLETIILVAIIFVLPVMLVLLVVLKLRGVRRFKVNRLSLPILMVVCLVSCTFSAYHLISPQVNNHNTDKAVRTQAALYAQKANYPLLVSSSSDATYQVVGLDWNVILDKSTGFMEQSLANTSSSYFQPRQGKCDIDSLRSGQPNTNFDPETLQCSLIQKLPNGLELYQQSDGGLSFGLYQNLLLEFGSSRPDLSKLGTLHTASKTELAALVMSKQFIPRYNDALNRWYNQQIHQRCYEDTKNCPFSL